MQIGDVVQLKSGGPWMTVRSVEDDEESCRTIWFSEHEHLHSDCFPIACLNVKPPDVTGITVSPGTPTNR